MNRFIKALVGTVVGLGIAATAMGSTGLPASTTPRQTIEYIGVNTPMPGLAYKLPALAQNAIDTCFVNVAPVFSSYLGASNAATTALVTGYASTVAGDSLNVSIDVGTNSEGPWVNVVSIANSYSHTAALGLRNNLVANSTLLMAPFWRVRLKSKGTATLVANKKFYIFFPHVGFSNTTKN
jgi:hypothetical protein